LFAATAAAKAAIESLAKTLAVELAPAGVTVNSVAPGYTQKDASGHSALSDSAWRNAIAKIPMGRIGVPDDAAALIAFLLSRDAGYITGQTIHVDGGLTLARKAYFAAGSSMPTRAQTSMVRRRVRFLSTVSRRSDENGDWSSSLYSSAAPS